MANRVYSADCCIVGAGPAGMILALLLARAGVGVALLEAHHDFDRDFRGDTIHPSTLELLDQLGLAERLHQLPHRKLTRAAFHTDRGVFVPADFSRLRIKFPYIMLMPQSDLLQFLAEELVRFPNAHLVMGANVEELLHEGDAIAGVRYRGADDQWHEVRAPLTVGTDGRFSRVRKLAGIEPIKSAPPMDVCWFRLPRLPEDEELELTIGGYFGVGHAVVLFDRPEREWQLGYIIMKGSFHELRAAGIQSLQRNVAKLIPFLADRVEALKDFHQISMLSVEVSRVAQWWLPGMLLLGDAAHVMSPVGGFGIQYAVQDAVAAANLLARPLKNRVVRSSHLEEVQLAREPAARQAQAFQSMAQQQIIARALTSDRPLSVPWFVRLLANTPFVRDLPARLLSRGFHPARLDEKQFPPSVTGISP